jgi:hypothetical protein
MTESGDGTFSRYGVLMVKQAQGAATDQLATVRASGLTKIRKP